MSITTYRHTLRVLAIALTSVLLAFLAKPLLAEAQPHSIPIWPAISLNQVGTGFASPVQITNAGDGTDRLFVVERDGRIKILGGGTFLDINTIVKGGGEEGLLSVAFPPDFARSKRFYVYFTDDRASNQGNNVVARFHVSGADSNVADPNSEEILLIFEHPDQANHNGGQLMFGPDGYLYIGTGDGGGSGDPYENAQDLGSPLGKILRIDVGASLTTPPTPGPYTLYLPFVATSGGSPYHIPVDNPFTGNPTALDEIWAYGLRNPWRFSFDRSTGDLWIGDVGQGSREEIDYQSAASAGGENYGWDCSEGAQIYIDTQPPGGNDDCPGQTFVDPVFDYDHTLGCSVTGGYVYRGSTVSDLNGTYLYADYCSGRVWGLQQDEGTWVSHEFLNGGFGLVSFGEDEAGELYLSRLDGMIYKVVEATP